MYIQKHCMRIWHAKKPKQHTGSLGAGVKDGCMSSCEFWKLTPGPLEREEFLARSHLFSPYSFPSFKQLKRKTSQIHFKGAKVNSDQDLKKKKRVRKFIKEVEGSLLIAQKENTWGLLIENMKNWARHDNLKARQTRFFLISYQLFL